MVEDDKEDRWYFTRDVLLANSPSRRHGYDADRELSCRQQAANLIQDMGQKLQVSQLCINTAIVYMHRFYVFHSLHAFPRNNIAAAALFLAAKVEEQPRKVEHVLKVAHMCLHRDNPSSLDIKSEPYQEQANELTLNESIILQTLGFEVAIDHPHTHVVRCCQLVKASKDLAQTSYFMASNSLHLTTMCLQYKPTVVACFCIHLACKWSNWEIPRSSEGKEWFWYVNQTVTLDLLEQMTSEFLIIFDKCPTKLKKKMMSMNQSNPVNFATPGNAPQENYHFDEPRKLIGAEANRPPEGFAQMQRSVERPSQPATAGPVGSAAIAGGGGGGGAAGGAVAAPPQQQHAPRHMDYKEYKEKRERAERERLLREGYQAQHLGTHAAPSHGPSKPLEKPKPSVSSQPQQQPPVPPPPHWSSSSVPAHKIYPNQTRSHPSQPAKEGPPHQTRPPSKEAVKRKFDEVEVSDVAYQKNPQDYRYKVQGQYLPPSYPGQPPGDSYPSKDTASSGRDIAQPYPHREKTSRVDEKSHPNHPYQRPPVDKYPVSRPSQASAGHHKGHREEVKKPEDLPPLDASSSEWHHKSGAGAGAGAGAGHSHPPHGSDRYNVPAKGAPALLPTNSSKPRDTKYKGHQSLSVPKETSQKSNGPMATAPSNHSSSMPHKKPQEKSAEKARKYHDQPERGLPSTMDKLLMGDDLRQKHVDAKRVYLEETPKKDKSAVPGKISHRAKPTSAQSHYKGHSSQQPPSQPAPSLFDLPDMDLELPQLSEPGERPAKIPRLDEKKKFDLFGERVVDRKKPETLAHSDRRKLELFGNSERTDDRKRHEPVVDEHKKVDVFGLTDVPKPAMFAEQTKPKTTFSIFSPDNSNKLDVHFPSFPKKSQSSLFSPPSVPGMLSHRGRSSSSTEREIMINSAVPFNMKVDKDKRQDESALSFFDTFDPKPLKEKPKIEVAPSIKTEPSGKPSFKEAAPKHEVKTEAVPALGGLPLVAPVSVISTHGQSGRPSVVNTIRHNISEVGAVVYPPADKFQAVNVTPAPVKTGEVSTVNLLNMVDMVDTRSNVAAVIKPVQPKMEMPAPKSALPPPPAKDKVPDDRPREEKPREDGESSRRSEKKKSRDKDRDKESYRHKDKKKSDGKKEKKKHKDKDKERKKDSHRDSERAKTQSDATAALTESSLKITIPKDKIAEVSGIKLKITKDKNSSSSSSKPVSPAKPVAPEGGSLKITIKKDAIGNMAHAISTYKDEKKKKKESSSHSSHKSSKSSKSTESSHKSSKNSSSSSSRVSSK